MEWLAKAIEAYADDGDALVLISSSGLSPNILRAAEVGKEMGLSRERVRQIEREALNRLREQTTIRESEFVQ